MEQLIAMGKKPALITACEDYGIRITSKSTKKDLVRLIYEHISQGSDYTHWTEKEISELRKRFPPLKTIYKK